MAFFKPDRTSGFPFQKRKPEEREKNFVEVQLPYTREEAMAEAERCVRCGDPICVEKCPLHSDIRSMCEAVARGDLVAAYRRVRETNALPGTTARCCPQLNDLCESVCMVGSQGQPVAIGLIQRFVADWDRLQSRQPNPHVGRNTGKSVAIVGGGPAGLAAAELLRRYGHAVTIYEELQTLGGTPWYGIPDFHLPKEILGYEVRKILEMGIEVRRGVRVGSDVSLTELRSEYDAVILATGSRDVFSFDIRGSGLKGIYDGYRFLEDVFGKGIDVYMASPKYKLGRDVLVIGGDLSALDCARTAMRLTHGKVTMVCRRTEAEMPVDPPLIEEAKEEGVEMKFLMFPESYNGSDDMITSVTMTLMKLGDADESGRRSLEPSGEEVELKCDSLIVVPGRGPDSYIQKEAGLRIGSRNRIVVDDAYMTSLQGVFAAGDVVSGETLVVAAMASGRESAQRTHEYLMKLKSKHVSLYDYYYRKRTTRTYNMATFNGEEEVLPPD